MKYIDNKRKLENEAFTELNSIIQNLESNSENSQHILTKLTESLEKILNENLYQAKNDDVSRQHGEILKRIISYAISISNLGSDDNYPLILKLFNLLLQIEYIIVQEHIESLWRIILMSKVESIDICTELLKRILEVYAKSHKMDLYIKSLLSVLSNIQMDAHIILRSPLFFTAILDEFSIKVTSNVSTSQAIEIIALFTSELFSLPGFFEQSIAINKSNKRRKLDEKNITDMKIVDPLILLMVKFLKALKISVSFKDETDKVFQTIFDRFIHPILSRDYSNKDELLHENLLYAALNLHHVLVDISTTYWKNVATSHFVDILFNATLKCPKSILFLNKVRLQHVYQSISSMKYQYDMNDDSIIILRKLIDSVLLTLKEPESPDITWTGKLVDLNEENFVVANFMIILGDWLDVVSNMCYEHHLALIVRFIINWSIIYSSIDLHHLKEVSIGTLCLRHLKSAEFFELKPLRDNFVKVYLEEISKCFKQIEISNENNKELDIILVIGQQSDRPNMLKSVISCFNESVETINPKICFPSTSINKLIKYFNLLHLFPMEYFTKKEVNDLSLLILLIDKWISLIKVESCDEFLDILKCSILCRSLMCKFISCMNRKDDILKKDVSFIIWWISSINMYQTYTVGYINDNETIQDLFEKFIQMTCQVFTSIIRQVLIIFQDNDDFKIDYLNKTVDYFKNLIDSIGESSSKEKDSSSDIIWRFTSEFLKLGIELAESRKQSKTFQLDSDNPVWKSIITLQSVSEKTLIKILSNTLDKAIQEIHNSNNSDDLKWKEKLSIEFKYYNNELKTYKICLQYYRLFKNSELEVMREASNVISLLSKFFKITTSMLHASLLEKDDTLDNKVVLIRCVTLLSIVIEFIFIINYKFNEDILIKIFRFVCDLMKIFYNEDPNNELSKELDTMFNSIISKLSNENYNIIADDILNKLEISSFSGGNNTNDNIIFLIHLTNIFLCKSSYEKLRQLEQKLPNLLCGIGGIAELINKVTYGIQILQILKFLICHRAFSFQSMDIGLVLSTVISLILPKRHYELSEEQEFKELFEEICYLLCDILMHRREQLYHSIPTFIFILQSMFHCFKKTQKSFKNNFKEIQQKDHQGRYISWWESRIKKPLPIESAKIFSRLLTTISKKSNRSSNSNKAFSKHIPSLLAEYIYIQTKNNILEANIRDILKNGIYSLLDLCGQFERDMIMVNLDFVGKNLFKNLWTDYNKEWKYVGRG
ncbi:hypothetical protein RclHR1_15690003 [Rhizophagus clarus]|uniref:Urb2/Npa2 family-domain-containing protein n=1 Tax=Rhizophagus clarus TaxID=94130 RepID=A0A2Z6R8I6_9GLOM|nr:hypothetical protein RclHR1_15690003 [Rhizophagus clarus]GES96761.1 Urb2/Npa2 family-domain-containing protein [Rhizophagus clarus]